MKAEQSKVIKQMEMDSLRDTFQDVRDVVILSMKGLNCHLEGSLRTTLRKRNIRLKVVKNSLMRLVFDDLGIGIGINSPIWDGPTMLAWGGNSVVQLSRTIDEELKKTKNAAAYKNKVTIKGVLAEGQIIDFNKVLMMPTHEESISQIITMILGPGSTIADCLIGPATTVAGQIQTLSKGG